MSNLNTLNIPARFTYGSCFWIDQGNSVRMLWHSFWIVKLCYTAEIPGQKSVIEPSDAPKLMEQFIRAAGKTFVYEEGLAEEQTT